MSNVYVAYSCEPSKFSKELKQQLNKNCEDIFRYIFDEVIPNLKSAVTIDFDWRATGDKMDYFRRYGGCFRMSLHPITSWIGNDYFELDATYCYHYAYSVFKRLNVKIDKKWFAHNKAFYDEHGRNFEDDFCTNFFNDYGLQLQFMTMWPSAKSKMLQAIDADNKLTNDLQDLITNFKL
jgi:hypothetical protein